MNQSTISSFINQNRDFLFPNSDHTEAELTAILTALPEDFEFTLQSISFKEPRLCMIFAVLGATGLDRFLLKDYVKGVLKLLTMGGLGIWWLIDIFTAKKRCRNFNCKTLIKIINNPSLAGQIKNTGIDNIDVDRAINIAKAISPQVKELKKSAKGLSDSLDARYY